MQFRRLLLPVTLAALAISAAPASAAPELGLVFGTRPSGQGVDPVTTTADLGARWVRVFGDWSVLEPAPDSWNPGYMDQFLTAIRLVKAQGRKVIVPVFHAPGWASGRSEASAPPRDPADYANFITDLIAKTGGQVDAWEIWNEPDHDDGLFWLGGPDPAGYTALLRAAYPAIKAADPDATVVTGGMVAGNFGFLRQLYANGAKGYFDAVGVHTDTACLSAEPEFFYREPTGEIGRYAFTGYREVYDVTRANGDPKPIWITELGWTTDPGICSVGARAGTKEAGVSEEQQADFLARAYHCLAQDDYVQVALWFSLQDVAADHDRWGLLRDDNGRKPAYATFKDLAANGDRRSGECGGRLDHNAPSVKILKPTAGATYYDHLPIKATATDDQGVDRMELWADGNRIPGSSKNGTFELDWMGSRELAFGRHTITIKAYDDARNVVEASVTVERIDPAKAAEVKPTVELKLKRLHSRSLRAVVSGRLRYANTAVRPLGTVRVVFQRKRGGRWQTLHKYSKGVRKPFTVRAKLASSGRWRVRAYFEPTIKPFVRSQSRTLSFRVG